MVNEFKKQQVKQVEGLIKKYPVVGIVNMHALPTPQLQRMRKKLRDSVELFVTKKRLIKIALQNLKKDKNGIEVLEEHMKGIPALLLSKENPFKLFSILQKNKSKAAAKAGQIAPNDIEIKAGPTPFAPGPIISELGNLGLKTKVEAGKIDIIADKVLVKEGEEISTEISSLLLRLGIEPMEVGLDLVAVYENGDIFTKDVLAIDEDEYFNNFTQAQRWAFNLSIEAGVLNDSTSEFLVQKAFKEAKAVALEGNILNDVTKETILAKAEAGMKALEKELNLPPKTENPKVEAKKEDKPKEVKVEEKKDSVEVTKEPVKEETKQLPNEDTNDNKDDLIEKEDKPKEVKKDSVEVTKEPVKEETKQLPNEDTNDNKDDLIEKEDKPKEVKVEEKTTDDKVDDMVDAWKKKKEPKPSAKDLVEESKE